MNLTLPRFLLSILLLVLAGHLVAEDPAPVAQPAATPRVACPECNGDGVAKCEVKGCVHGKIPCAKPCLKKTEAWEDRKDPAQPQVHRWLKMYSTDHTTSVWFPETMIGHVVSYDGSGVPHDAGLCPDCKGTGLVECPTCKGTSKVVCPLCNGEKQVPEPTAKDYIAKRDQERAAHAIVLTDGTIIYGKVVTRMPDKVMIKTEEGKMVEVDPAKIQSEPPPEPKTPRKPKEPAKK